MIKRFLLTVLVGGVAGVLALISAFVLTPLWSWIEWRTGIESIGHSGPAPWCFAILFGSYLGLAAIIAWITYRRRHRNRVAAVDG